MGGWQQDLREFAQAFEGATLESAFRAADRELAEGFEQNFYNELDHEGAFWPQHSPMTIQRHGVHPLLILTGKMFNAATKPDDPGHLYQRDGDTLVVGIRGAVVPYARYHHTGTRKMPRRRVIYANQQTLNKALEAFSDAAEAELLKRRR